MDPSPNSPNAASPLAQRRASSIRTPAYEALIARLKAETTARKITKPARR